MSTVQELTRGFHGIDDAQSTSAEDKTIKALEMKLGLSTSKAESARKKLQKWGGLELIVFFFCNVDCCMIAC